MRFCSVKEDMKDWSPRVWPNVLIVVVLAAGWLVAACGGPPSPPSERCGSVQFVNGQPQEPKVVVILIDGVGSQEDAGGKFYPVSVAHPDNGVQTVASYCPVDSNGNARNKDHGWPVGLEQELRRWSEFSTSGGSSGSSGSSGSGCGSSGSSSGTCSSDVCKDGVGLNTDKCLVARLADAGAVLLPYSYTGAILSKETSAFTFNPYQASDTKQRPHTSAEKLDDELRSIHTAWPQTHIVIVGHSYGGLIAELWWEAISVQHIDHRGVVHVFSLDAPINGVDHCRLAAVPDGGFVSDEWCQLWDHRQTRDQLIINFDALDPSFMFTPVGTPNDPTYNGLISGGGDLQPQVLYSYSCDMTNPQCIKQPPSYVSRNKDCDGQSGNIDGTKGHDIVKVCPQVVKFIVCSVQAARDNGNQQDCYPSSSSPTPTHTAGPSGTITEFPIPTAHSGPQTFTVGPDGNLWFTEYDGNKIGRITPSGGITEFPVPTPHSGLQSITIGPDGNLWFTEDGANVETNGVITEAVGDKIGRITPSGVIIEFQIPTAHCHPASIVKGPDGNLWFNEAYADKIGRITPSGVITEFPTPTNEGPAYTLTMGPDGNLWFTSTGNIGRITPSGGITEYRLPDNVLTDNLMKGPDGNLWFVEFGENKIGRITPTGVITLYPTPATLSALPKGTPMTAGPDGNLWFTETNGNIGRITPAGVITEFQTNAAPLSDITTGPDGNLWFIGTGTVGRITPAGAITSYQAQTEGGGPEYIITGPDGNLWFTETGVDKIGRIIP